MTEPQERACYCDGGGSIAHTPTPRCTSGDAAWWRAQGERMSEYMTIDQMEVGGIYRLHSRNLAEGLWDESERGFRGVREKFGHRFLFIEYHWDTGAPHGTAKPLEKIGQLA